MLYLPTMDITRLTILVALLILAGAIGYFLHVYLSPMHDHKIFGRTERGLVTEDKLPMKIRMDTGAQTSSLSAHDIQEFKKDGKRYVRFIIEPERVDGRIHQFELPLKRTVRIRKRQGERDDTDDIHPDAEFERRPVVELPLCLGNETKKIEVTLTDRSNFNYGMLLGRSAMEQFGILIDPSISFTTHVKCEHEK